MIAVDYMTIMRMCNESGTEEDDVIKLDIGRSIKSCSNLLQKDLTLIRGIEELIEVQYGGDWA